MECVSALFLSPCICHGEGKTMPSRCRPTHYSPVKLRSQHKSKRVWLSNSLGEVLVSWLLCVGREQGKLNSLVSHTLLQVCLPTAGWAVT